MRWFIIRFLLFAAPLLLLLAGMECALRRIPNNYAYTDAQLMQHGAAIQVLVLGNSHAYNGVDPESLGVRAYNAANISQDHRLDRALLERYIDGLPDLKYIVLPVSYASIGSRIEDSQEAWRTKNYVLYMGLPKFARSTEDRFELLNGEKKYVVRRLWKHWARGHDDLSCGPHGGAPGQVRPNLDMEASGATSAKRHTKGTAGAYEENNMELERIIRLAQQRNVRVLLFAPPAYSTYRTKLDPQQLALSRSIPEMLINATGNATYLDLMADPRFVLSDFANSDHLNATGRAKLTRILSSQLTMQSGMGVDASSDSTHVTRPALEP
ncbi:MAG: hypothetical protein IPL52_01185 [Flavobacteriales bacterium]|nr:hypothetical protein [Flavobacteriales bacterium]